MKGETAVYFFFFLGIGMVVIGAACWLVIEGWLRGDTWQRIQTASGALVVLGLVNDLLSPLALFIH